MTSAYLRDRPRALIECREDTYARIEELKARIAAWTATRWEADDGEVCDTLGLAIDNASDEIGRLLGRLDMLDDELGWRRSDDPGRPVVL